MEILQKLLKLERNLEVLEEIKDELTELDIKKKWEIRYGLFESIQIVIDTSCKVVARYNLAKPQNYKECILALGDKGYLTKELAKKLAQMVGFRNILIHEYCEVDREKLLEYLSHLDDFKEFIKAMKEH